MKTNSASTFFSSLSSLWSTNESPSQLLMNKEILKIAHSLNGVLQDVKKVVDKDTSKKNESFYNSLSLPRLVVVGTQSSGKSTLLNRLICMDLLPTGSQMVTRTPLHMYLRNSLDTTSKIEFGKYTNGRWTCEKCYEITMPIPTEEEIESIRSMIHEQTNRKAGQCKNISYSPIYMTIQTPFVPELQLVDLPGLTMVACRDKGQPKDIKEQIKKMVTSYIKDKKTIILSVMASRTDLETDLALDLIKEIDPEGKRTVGVLTKVDLMNTNTDISSYLSNNISRDLQLSYGYYALRNRTSEERDTHSILEGIELENEFFNNHLVYKKPEYKNLLGIVSVGDSLSTILQTEMRKTLPITRDFLHTKIENVKKDLDSIGVTIPVETEGLKLLLHKTIIDISNRFKKTVLGYSTNLPYGREIKEVLINCRHHLHKISPFSEKNTHFTKDYLENYIQNSQGNHMAISYTPIHLLEHCFSQSTHSPFKSLRKPAELCCTNIKSIISSILNNILKDEKYNRYPNLCSTIKTLFLEKKIEELEIETLKKVDEFLSTEENYIWTCEESFYTKLSSIHQQNTTRNIEYKRIIGVLSAYFSSIQTIAQHTIPKIIMYQFVHKAINVLSIHLFTNTTNYVNVSLPSSNNLLGETTDNFYKTLFLEPSEIASKRSQYNLLYSRLLEANKLLSTISL